MATGEQLYNLIMDMKEKEALELVEQGADINYKDPEYGATVLLVACNRGLKEVVNVLIGKDADVNVQQSAGYTCLITAAYGGHVEIVKMLLESGADKSTKNNDGLTALQVAEKEGKTEVVSVLTARDGRNLYNAIMCKDAKEALALIEDGADINWKDPTYAASVLLVACNRGLKDVVDVLIGKDADVNAQQSYGYTCLLTAAYGGHVEIVKLLLESGADKSITTKSGDTVVMLAEKSGNAELMQVLKARDGRNLYNAIMCKQETEALALIADGADVNWKDPTYEASVLLVACNRGLINVVNVLIEKGADVNAQQSYGYTCLITAAYGGHADVVKKLLESGADKNMKTKADQTALELAEKSGHAAVVTLLSA